MKMGLNLFEGTDDEDDISKIEINTEFARRFEHNKKREDLHRFEELKKKGHIEDDESSEESDEDEDLINSGKKDLKFYETLVRIKKQDPVINQKDMKFFDSDQDEEGEKQKRPKDKPLYLKDVMARQLIEEGPEFDEKQSKSKFKSYSEEQEEFRKAFLDAAGAAFEGENEDLIMEKKKSGEVNEDDDNGEIHKTLDEYFGEDESLNESEMFLKKFFVNKMWVHKDMGKKPSEEDLEEISAEEEELDEEEKYEAQYNYRYEEGTGDRVLGHARFIDGTVRKKTNARKLQRQRKEERMTQKETEMEQELKYLKNLKMKEIMDKLQKVRTIAGIKDGEACALNEDDLDEEFDPDEYDRKMRETFDVDYYEADEVDPGFGSGDEDDVGDIEKPDFDKEDELIGLPKGWDESGSRDGFLAVREKVLKRKGESKEVVVEEEEPLEGDKKKRKQKISLQEKDALEKELEEYYKLDYEDTIGDLKTRFKYTSVPSNRYGLSSKEILLMDEKDLNQYVSLKKLAPYRQDEWKVSKQQRYHLKMNNKLLLQGRKSKNPNQTSKRVKPLDAKQEKVQLEEVDAEVGLSRRSKRRRRQAELKLSHSRLMAYGKLLPKAKIKKTTKLGKH